MRSPRPAPQCRCIVASSRSVGALRSLLLAARLALCATAETSRKHDGPTYLFRATTSFSASSSAVRTERLHHIAVRVSTCKARARVKSGQATDIHLIVRSEHRFGWRDARCSPASAPKSRLGHVRNLSDDGTGVVVILIGNVTYCVTPPGLWLAEVGPAPFLIGHDGQVQIEFGRQLSITPSTSKMDRITVPAITSNSTCIFHGCSIV
jgi:hypothetical protein